MRINIETKKASTESQNIAVGPHTINAEYSFKDDIGTVIDLMVSNIGKTPT